MQNCKIFKCSSWWFGVSIHWKISSHLVNWHIHHFTSLSFFSFLVKTFKFYYLSEYQIYCAVIYYYYDHSAYFKLHTIYYVIHVTYIMYTSHGIYEVFIYVIPYINVTSNICEGSWCPLGEGNVWKGTQRGFWSTRALFFSN